MSIDLLIEPVRPIHVAPLLPRIATVLAEMLGSTTVPALVMKSLEEGKQVPVSNDKMGTDDAPLLLISVSGEVEAVGLLGRADHLTVTIFGRRSPLQYALGAATAITFAREFGDRIWDDSQFFGDEIHTSPETLFERLRVEGPNADLNAAAERINWGPAGGP